jgi:hypothetical protein
LSIRAGGPQSGPPPTDAISFHRRGRRIIETTDVSSRALKQRAWGLGHRDILPKKSSRKPKAKNNDVDVKKYVLCPSITPVVDLIFKAVFYKATRCSDL